MHGAPAADAGVAHSAGTLPLAKPSTQNLAELAALVESVSITPIVDKIFTFQNAAEAIRYLEVEHARAKVAY